MIKFTEKIASLSQYTKNRIENSFRSWFDERNAHENITKHLKETHNLKL